MREKIKISFLVLFLSGFVAAFGQIKIVNESDDLLKKTFEYNIDKGITSLGTTRYDMEEGQVTGDLEKISEIKMDLNGNAYTEIVYYPNYSKTVYKFNELKNITDVSIYYSDNTLMSKVITVYESDLVTVKEKIYYFGSSMTFKTKNSYKSLKLVKQDYLDSIGKILSYSKFFYDGKDRLIQEDKYNEKDTLEIIYQYIYDESGNCIEESINYPQSKYTSRISNKYDNNGRKTEKSVYSLGDKLISKNEYRYNNAGLLSEDLSYSIDGKVVSKNEYKYDDKGNKVEWRFTDLIEDVEYLYKYEYGYK